MAYRGDVSYSHLAHTKNGDRCVPHLTLMPNEIRGGRLLAASPSLRFIGAVIGGGSTEISRAAGTRRKRGEGGAVSRTVFDIDCALASHASEHHETCMGALYISSRLVSSTHINEMIK
jgi:hypothetical protein